VPRSATWSAPIVRAADRSWRDRAGDGGRFRPTHCDIVVRAAPGALEAVGGNVRDAVTLSRFPTEAERELVTAQFQNKNVKNREAAVDLVWALLNSTEFRYRH
jgi:hypothetical protein